MSYKLTDILWWATGSKIALMLVKEPEANDRFAKTLTEMGKWLTKHGYWLARGAIYAGCAYLGYKTFEPMGIEASTLGALSGIVAVEVVARSPNLIASGVAASYLAGLGLWCLSLPQVESVIADIREKLDDILATGRGDVVAKFLSRWSIAISGIDPDLISRLRGEIDDLITRLRGG